MRFQINELHAMILPVMDDGRERTASDVFRRLKKTPGFAYAESAVSQAMAALRDNGYLRSCELSRLVAYRKKASAKKPEVAKPKLPRKVGRPKIQFQGFAHPVGEERWSEEKLRDRWLRSFKG